MKILGISETLRRLSFRPERNRPVWRNKHTGKEATVVDLGVNDRGGFQGGCRQHIVITDEPGPPGFPGGRTHPLESWLRHWEPTDRYVDWPNNAR